MNILFEKHSSPKSFPSKAFTVPSFHYRGRNSIDCGVLAYGNRLDVFSFLWNCSCFVAFFAKVDECICCFLIPSKDL